MGRRKGWILVRTQNLPNHPNRDDTDQRTPTIEQVERSLGDVYLMKISGKLLAFAILVHGAIYEQIKNVLTEFGIKVVSKATFFEAQKLVSRELIKLGKESIQNWQSQLKHETVLCIDGCWDHPRNGKHCVVSFIDNINWKIIALKVLSMGGNYKGPSNGMESSAIEKIIEKMKRDKDIKEKTIAYCHDCDSKVRCLFQNSGWNIRELLDQNHALKSFAKSFEKTNVQNGGCLKNIYVRLKLWVYHLLLSDLSIDAKTTQFMNAAEHFTGNHKNCVHSKDQLDFINPVIHDPKTKSVLVSFLEQNQYIILQCDTSANTQQNESYNSLRAKFAPKAYNWNNSFKARSYAALLDFNEYASDWREKLRERIGLDPLPQELQSMLDSMREKQKQQSIERRKEEIQQKERLRRLKVKNKLYKLEQSCTQYNSMHIPYHDFVVNDSAREMLYRVHSEKSYISQKAKDSLCSFFFSEFGAYELDKNSYYRKYILMGLDKDHQNLSLFIQITAELIISPTLKPRLDESILDEFDLYHREMITRTIIESDQFFSQKKVIDGICEVDVTKGNLLDPNPYTVELENCLCTISQEAQLLLNDVRNEYSNHNPKTQIQLVTIVMPNPFCIHRVANPQNIPLLCYPYVKTNSMAAWLKPEGILIKTEEMNKFPLILVQQIDEDFAFVFKHAPVRALVANSEMSLYIENDKLIPVIHAKEKIFYPITERQRKNIVKAGSVVTLDWQYQHKFMYQTIKSKFDIGQIKQENKMMIQKYIKTKREQNDDTKVHKN